QRLEARRSGTFIRELYESAIEADPSFARAYSDYAAFLYWSGLPLGLSERESYAIAREILYAVNRADPERRRATRWLDDALLARIDGNWEGEEYALRQQILAPSAYQPPDHSVYEQYGALLLRSGLFDEALRYCDLALIHDPDNTSVMGLRGVAYLTLGKFDKALEAFDHALALTPSMFELHQMRAVALLGLDKVDEAAEEWDYFYASHRVRLHFARGERAQAWKVLEKAIDDLDADSNLAGMRSEEIGYGFALLGALDRAFEWWQRALEYGPPRMQAIRYSRVPFRAAADARYTELLEAVGLTDEWRHELCSRVALLEPVTGVEANCISVLASIE
ncbi:MAG: tetratricopeptide repeat protein, partial [Gammaproteobacteria bacterium]